MAIKDKKTAEVAPIKHRIMTVIGTVICIILLPVLLINITPLRMKYLV